MTLAQVVHAFLVVLRHPVPAARVGEENRIALPGHVDEHLATFLQIDRVDDGSIPAVVVGFQSGGNGVRVGRVDGDGQVRDGLREGQQLAYPLVALFGLDRHLVHAQIDDVRSGPFLRADGPRDVVDVVVAKRNRDVRDSGGCDLGLVLRIRLRDVEDPLRSVKVGIPQAGLVTLLEHAGAVRPQAAGRIEVLPDDDQAELVHVQLHALIPRVSFSTDARWGPPRQIRGGTLSFPRSGTRGTRPYRPERDSFGNITPLSRSSTGRGASPNTANSRC